MAQVGDDLFGYFVCLLVIIEFSDNFRERDGIHGFNALRVWVQEEPKVIDFVLTMVDQQMKWQRLLMALFLTEI